MTADKLNRKRIRPRIGDIFEIPVGPGMHVYGQVLEKDLRTYLVVVFRPVETEWSRVERAEQEVGLAGIVFDAKLINGDWPIIGNEPAMRYADPLFASGHEDLDGLTLEDFARTHQRPATPDEAARHGHRHLSYPMVLQMAAAAMCGRRDWEQRFDHLQQLAAELTGRR